MAKMKMCCVHDVKSEAFNLPMTFPSIGVGIRDFTDAFSSPDNKMSKHRADFNLYYVGDFDTADGSFEPVFPPKLVFNGADIVVGGE